MTKIEAFDSIDVVLIQTQEVLTETEDLLLEIAGEDMRIEATDFDYVGSDAESQIRRDLNLNPNFPWHAVDRNVLLDWAHATVMQEVLSDLFSNEVFVTDLSAIIERFGPHLDIEDLYILKDDITKSGLNYPVSEGIKKYLALLVIARDSQALNRRVLAEDEFGIYPAWQESIDAVIDSIISGNLGIRFGASLPTGVGAYYDPLP